ncbi:hypothetical protein THAOC_23625, partial [Thalassiosira oceanica]
VIVNEAARLLAESIHRYRTYLPTYDTIQRRQPSGRPSRRQLLIIDLI